MDAPNVVIQNFFDTWINKGIIMKNADGIKNHLSKTYEKIQFYLDIWAKKDFDNKDSGKTEGVVAYNLASFYGQYLRLGGEKSLVVPRGDELARLAYETAKKANFPQVYKKLEAKLEKMNEPLELGEAIFFLRKRDNAQLAYHVIRDKFADTETAKKWFDMVLSWMKIEDGFFDKYSWAFFEAAPWLLEQRELFIESIDFSWFPWFYLIPDAVESAGRLPRPSAEFILGSEEKMEYQGHVGFEFVSAFFAKPLGGNTHRDVLFSLAAPKMAAESSTGYNMEILSDIIENLEFIRVKSAEAIPGFVVAISHEMKIDLIFQDTECRPLRIYEGATAKIGTREIPIKNGRASFEYTNLKSLYFDLRRLDELLEIAFSSGKTVSKFLPE